MATSPTTKSAPLSGAAKDDSVGGDGHFTFTIKELLANDPGGAAKVDLTKQFLFGTKQADWDDQATYLANHGITDNGDGTYTINSDARDFQYMVQIGNKGTWSTADVHVTAPDPVVEPHAGDLLFKENFDGYSMIDDHGTWGVVNLSTGITDESPSKGHAWAIADGNGGWAPVTGEIVKGDAGSIDSTGWLDTQNSPGGINITNWFTDPTGGEFRLSFDLGIHDFGDGPFQETDHHATFDVRIDNQTVKTITYDDVFKAAGGAEKMGHFDFTVDVGTGDVSTAHTISFVDTTQSQDNYVGFALDNIQVHDWLL